MAYFRILIGLRGCYSDSSCNEVHMCATPAELHEVIADKFAWYSETGEDADESADPCTLEQAEAIFADYTSPRAPYLPTCAASWSDGEWGVLVSAASEHEYAETMLGEHGDSWEAPSGTVYFLAPSILAPWIEYGPEGIEGAGAGAEEECNAYEAQAAAEYGIPETGVIVNVSTDAEYSFESLYAFTTPNGQTYRGAATVLAYVPALGGN